MINKYLTRYVNFFTYIYKKRKNLIFTDFFFLSIRSILIWKILWYYKKKRKFEMFRKIKLI